MGRELMKQGKRHHKSESRVMKMIEKHPQPGLFFVLSGSDNILNFGTTITAKATARDNSIAHAQIGDSYGNVEELATLRKENEMLRERLADKKEQIAFLRSLVCKGTGAEDSNPPLPDEGERKGSHSG